MTLARTAVAEVGARVDAFRGELEEWNQQAAQGTILERHHTQLRSVTHVMASAAEAIVERLHVLDDRFGEDVDWNQIASVRRTADTLADIWQLFLEAFGMRSVASFSLHLQIADELAWACYAPVNRLVEAGSIKEPPLVTPTAQGDSAFASPRDSLRNRTLQLLPVPLVSLPWSDIKHLPSLPLLASNVGHIVALDLDLHAALFARFESDAGLPPSRVSRWRDSWDEIVATAYGVLALGPAFARALMTVLATDLGPTGLAGTRQDAPPRSAIRLGVILETLRSSGFEDEAHALRGEWLKAIPHVPSEFEADVAPAVRAIVASPLPQLGARPLRDVVGISPRDQEMARASADAVLRGRQPPAADVRLLVASARLAFDADPYRYAEAAVDARIRRRIVDVAVSGTRNFPAGPPGRFRIPSELVEPPAPPSPPVLDETQELTRNKRFAAGMVEMIKSRR